MARSANDDRPAAPLQGVLFDLDNTLVPFFPALHAWAAAWAGSAAPRALRRRVATELLHQTFAAGEDPAGAMRTLAGRHGFDHEVLQAANERAHQAYLDALRPYEGVPDLLDHLAGEGLQLALVTDAPDARARERIDASGLGHHFETFITRDMTPRGKRGPEPFHLALDALGLAPGDVAMIGDYPAIDAVWPNRLGMRSVLAGWGYREGLSAQSHWERPWAVARTPGHVPAVLREPGPRPERPLSEWVG